MTRYMYVNSKRSSHAIEKVTIEAVDGTKRVRQVALCYYPLHDVWPMSFEPKKRVCKMCQMVIDHREKVAGIKFRTLTKIGSPEKDNPWRLPKGAINVAVTYIDGCPYAHFFAVGKVVIKLSWLDHWAKKFPDRIECICDPTVPEPVKPPSLEENIAALPLFEVSA